jgi:hypothetical protein
MLSPKKEGGERLTPSLVTPEEVPYFFFPAFFAFLAAFLFFAIVLSPPLNIWLLISRQH